MKDVIKYVYFTSGKSTSSGLRPPSPQGEGKSILSSDMPFCKVRASNNSSYSFLHVFVKCIFKIRKTGTADGDHTAVVENRFLISEARYMI